MTTPTWISAALDYVPRWIGYQMAATEQPGAVIAVAHKGEVIFEQAFGVANLATGEAMTPRHRFRVASHSKSFTAAGVMKLREAGKLSLDDRAGRFVAGLHEGVAQATIAQLLSHSAGITRDGPDGGQFVERRPFLSLAELKADLARQQPLAAAETFKYSNHGIALAGHIIEAVTGESYAAWMSREVLVPLALAETVPDMTASPSTRPPFVVGHSTKLPYGHRVVVPGFAAGNAMAPATGFASTARDLVTFFSCAVADIRAVDPLRCEPTRDDAPPLARQAFGRSNATMASAPSSARSGRGRGGGTPAAGPARCHARLTSLIMT